MIAAHDIEPSLKMTTIIPGRILEVRLSGKLEKSDYEDFIPEIDRLIEERPAGLRLLVIFDDFKGWDAGGFWEDLKFGAGHLTEFERLAMVGDTTWEKAMAMFCKPITTADVKYFPIEEADRARAWIQEGCSF